MTDKQKAYAWLKLAKQNKQRAIDRMTKLMVEEYEKEHGEKPKYIEAL
ncbi:MAG: hypothetical protein PUD15_01890 [Prevotella sp.]|nr:hypothetical protein [Prevotella sp. AGR2160]MDD5861296.1 hypothetical protein [Prevotella sp.]